jgi:hypothetical protein
MNRELADLYEHSSSSSKHFTNQNRLKGGKIRDRTYHIDDEDILIEGMRCDWTSPEYAYEKDNRLYVSG